MNINFISTKKRFKYYSFHRIFQKKIIKNNYKISLSLPNYNSVIGSAIKIYIRLTQFILMSFAKTIPNRIVRDVLTQEEITKVQSLVDNGKFPLIAICKIHDNDSFCGYYPLNAGLNENLTVHRVDGNLDILGNFCTGG